jgi:dolichyl-phosphate-mannose-protein mannosyltransferase
VWIVAGLLGLIVVAGLALRLRNIGYGLPYVYNYDEASHFTNRAVGMLNGGLDPNYFQNPSGLTYLVYALLRVQYVLLGGIFPLQYHGVGNQLALDPTPIFKSARVLVAVLGMLGAVATFEVGRRLWNARVGLVAAALLAFAFLPVTYSRVAVTDVGTFLPIAVAFYGVMRIHDRGRLTDYLLAGAGTGFAIGFKYTAGLIVLPAVLAAVARIWNDHGTALLKRRDMWYLLAGGVLLVFCFFLTTPYFFFRPVTAIYQLKQQASAAGDTVKLGQEQEGGFVYYLKSFGWGFGYAPLIAALAGAAIEARRNWFRALLIVLFPVALYLYMGAQTRYFGRWLLPIYPILALLVGVAVARAAELLPARRRVQAAAAGALCVALLAQSLAADLRTTSLEGRADTRQQARDWLVAHYPRKLRVVIEPGVPTQYYRLQDAQLGGPRQFANRFVRDLRRGIVFDAPDGADLAYAQTLSPDLIDTYRQTGYCMVMTMSVIRGRAENAQLPDALAYYHRLERESDLVYRASPYKPGRGPVPLHYDFSYNYYPTAYHRPGPVVDIYRLRNCTQEYGRVARFPAGDSGLDKGVATSFER